MGIKAILIDNEAIEFAFLYFMCFVHFLLTGIAIKNKSLILIMEFWLLIESWNLSLCNYFNHGILFY